MKTRTILRILGGLTCWFCGCDRPAAAPPVTPQSLLRFPVILVWPGQSVLIERPIDGLKSMRINYLYGDRKDPVVIDSDLKIYDMKDLTGTKGGLAMMLDPNGFVPIKFKLAPHAKQGLATARQLIIDCQWLGGDSDAVQLKRTEIADATTLDQMIAILQGDLN